ncbi:MAG: flagellar hook-associated family protein [Rhizobiales bacterium]|nr:flagellar hook-associated family protein [Hyphomicrobiales bacterium]
MKTSIISTAGFAAARFQSINTIQKQLADLQVEISSGRHADQGLALGHRTGEVISLRGVQAQFSSILDTNRLLDSRLTVTQSALGDLSSTAESFVNAMVPLRGNPDKAEISIQAAREQLAHVTSSLNSSVAGQYLFAGINTDEAPLLDYYDTPASAAKTAVDAAFFAEFGFSQTDPLVNTITGADMENFLDGAFNTLFDSTNWDANWSNASVETQSQRIEPDNLLKVGVSAQERPFAELASALVMVADLGLENLNRQAYATVLDRAIETAASANEKLNDVRASVGLSQERIEHADEAMQVRLDFLAIQIGELENVDPYEKSTELNNLLTSLEISYAITGRLQSLRLSQYL